MLAGDVRLEMLSPEAAVALRDRLTLVYQEAFSAPGYDEPEEALRQFRDQSLPQHVLRDGFRCVAARRSDDVIGFAYGYTGQRGQWWSDWVAKRSPATVVRHWLGGHFEFVELAVRPCERGQGIGTSLHDALLDGLPHEVALLTTYCDDRPATRLYRRKGWQLLVAGLDGDRDLYGLDLRGQGPATGRSAG